MNGSRSPAFEMTLYSYVRTSTITVSCPCGIYKSSPGFERRTFTCRLYVVIFSDCLACSPGWMVSGCIKLECCYDSLDSALHPPNQVIIRWVDWEVHNNL